MKVSAFALICILVSGSAISADKSACNGLTRQQAYATVRDARSLVADAVMYELEGEMPKLLQAYRCLATSPNAQTNFESLLSKGKITGQLMALAAIWDLNPKAFAPLAAPFRQRRDQVFLVSRDVVRTAEARTVVTWIEEGVFSELLRGYGVFAEKRGGLLQDEPSPRPN
jgi:hypothetical protein